MQCDNGTEPRCGKTGGIMQHDKIDDDDLSKYGYEPKLSRAIGGYTSFALSFSMVTITTTIFTLFADPFTKLGGVGIWLWLPVTAGVMVLTLVYGHLAARMPVTGYAYQWSSRLVGPHFGALVGWVALCSFFVGTASIALAMASVFAPEIWDSPTQHQIQLIAGIAIALAVIINVVGVKAAGWINNVGATTELVGTLGLGAVTFVGLLFFFDHKEGPSVLFDTHPVGGGEFGIGALGLAALLPLYTLLGWEGAADLAEETHNPRRTAPRAMLRAVLVSGIAGFVIYAIFAMAIPYGIEDTVNQPRNPLFYVVSTQLGTGAAHFIEVVALISIFAALLANVTVATRMLFALSRDNVVPFGKRLANVSDMTRTPVLCVLVVGAFALGINLLSAGLVAKVLSLTAVAYYTTYLLTMAATIYGARRDKIPTAPSRYFNLGRWLVPLAGLGIVWSLIVIAYGTLPEGNRVAAEYFGYALVIGVLYWVLYLRRKINRGEAGPPRQSAQVLPPAAVGEDLDG
jgi:amino acid transporter